ncbi:MAG: hypothetical protein JJU36_16565 [Phycisphaeraceae bacterium]|nr:hypothetical protein [Phycisphaeraceae bacterium]
MSVYANGGDWPMMCSCAAGVGCGHESATDLVAGEREALERETGIGLRVGAYFFGGTICR